MLLRKKFPFRILCLLPILLPAAVTSLRAGTYYVDQSHPLASDLNPGSADQPFATINHATQSALPGDTIRVRPGVYRETFSFANSGTEESPISLVADDPQQRPVVSGGDLLDGWVDAGDGLYSTVLPAAPNGLFQDGVTLPMSMHPDAIDPEDLYRNSLWFLVESGDVVVPGSAEESAMLGAGIEYLYLDGDFATVDGAPAADDYWNGALLYHYQAYSNATNVREVLDYDASLNRITVPLLSSRINPPNGSRYDRYALANHPGLIDSPGEFAVVGTTVYLRPLNDLLTEVEGRIRPTGFSLTRPHLVVDGLEIRYCTGNAIEDTYAHAADDFTLLNSYIHHNGGSGFTSRDSWKTRIEGCELSYNNNNGIAFGSRTGDIEIIGCHIHHNNNNGIWLGSGGGRLIASTGILIKGCRVEFQGSSQLHPDNIQFQQVDNLVIEDNYLEQTGHQNMWCQYNGRVLFRRNIFVNGTLGLNSMTRSEVYNNVFHNASIRYDSWQGTLDEWMLDIGDISGWGSMDRLTTEIQGDISGFPLNLIWDDAVPIIQQIRALPPGESIEDQDEAFKQEFVDYLNSVIGDLNFYQDHPGIYAGLDADSLALLIVDAVIDRGLMDSNGILKAGLTTGEEAEIRSLNHAVLKELVLGGNISSTLCNFRPRDVRVHNNIVIEGSISQPPASLELQSYFDIRHNYLNIENSYMRSSWELLGGTGPETIIQQDNSLAAAELADPDGRDYTLLPESLLVDAGTEVGLPFQASAPDIGPAETPYLARPVISHTQGSESEIAIFWTQLQDVMMDHYTVRRGESVSGPWIILSDSSSGTELIDDLVFNDVPYYYTVQSHMGGLSSIPSAPRMAMATRIAGQDDFEDTTVSGSLGAPDPGLVNGTTWSLLQGGARIDYCTDCYGQLSSNYLHLGVNQSEPSWLVNDLLLDDSFDLDVDIINKYVVGDQGIFLFFQDEENHYKLVVNRDEFKLVRVLGGVATVIGSDPSLSTQHQLSTAHYRVRVRPAPGGLTFACTKSDWILLNDPANPVFDPAVYETTFMETDPSALSVFDSGYIGFFQDRTYIYTVAGYDNVVITDIHIPEVTLTQWQEQTMPGQPAGITAPNEDPDLDGWKNLLEYAFRLDPLQGALWPVSTGNPAGGGIPALELDWTDPQQPALTLLYHHRNDPQLSYQVEAWDTGSGTWVPAAARLAERIHNGDDTELRRIELTDAPDSARPMFRLNVQYQE